MLVTDMCETIFGWIRCDWTERYVVVMVYDDHCILDFHPHFNHMCHIKYPPRSMMVLDSFC